MAKAMTPSRLIPLAFGALCVIAAFSVLEVLLRFDIINRYIVPLPSDVILSLKRIIIEENVLARCRETAYEMGVSAGAVILIGIPIGVALHRYAALRLALEDWVAALAAVPIVLAFPLFLVLFGRSSTTIIVMSIANGLAPIILKTTEGLMATRPVLINVGKSLKLSPAQMFWKILLPSALPIIFTYIRLSWTFVLISVVGVEFLINLGGLGQLINDLAERYDMLGTYASIGFVIAVSVAFFMMLEHIEHYVGRRA